MIVKERDASSAQFFLIILSTRQPRTRKVTAASLPSGERQLAVTCRCATRQHLQFTLESAHPLLIALFALKSTFRRTGTFLSFKFLLFCWQSATALPSISGAAAAEANATASNTLVLDFGLNITVSKFRRSEISSRACSHKASLSSLC